MSRRGSETGSVAVELAILTPALVLLLLFVVLVGRVGQTRVDVTGAAADAARAASLRQAPASARLDAERTAQRTLADRGVACRQLRVATDTRSLRPGGRVSVEVRCTVDLRDLALLAVPGTREISARAVEVVDVFRGS